MKIYRAQTSQYLALSKISAKRAHPWNSPGVCSFRWILAVFHRAGFHTSIVILWEKQSRRTRICTLTSKTSTPLILLSTTTAWGLSTADWCDNRATSVNPLQLQRKTTDICNTCLLYHKVRRQFLNKICVLSLIYKKMREIITHACACAWDQRYTCISLHGTDSLRCPCVIINQ